MIGVYAFVPRGKLTPMYIGHSKDVQKRNQIIPTPWECESINDVLTGYENPPWRTQSVAMSAWYKYQKETFKQENQQ